MRCVSLLISLVVLHLLAAGALGDIEAFAPGRTFENPMTDPRWPRFTATWQEYDDDRFLGSVGAVGIGGTLAILRDLPPDATVPIWEVGVQAGIFGTFEPLESSQNLFNSDWQFGLYGAARRGKASGMLRLWHQSSHLGDEFILENPDVTRVNFSFESASALASYDVQPWLRLYGGGGWIFNETPSDYGNWFIQYGVELRSPRTIFSDHARPFAAMDVQHYQGTEWQADVSVMTGLELRDPRRLGPTMRVVLEFYDGRNPNGQFFEEDARYLGAGLQLTL